MESLNSLFPSTYKPPRSRISDFLPSNIIDEIDFYPQKLLYQIQIFPSKTSTSTLSGSNLLYNTSTIRVPPKEKAPNLM